MKFTVLLVLCFSIFSCAHVSTEESLYGSYSGLVGSIKSGDYSKATSFISNERRANVASTQSFEEGFPFVYSLSTAIAKEESHFESRSNGRSCLTISGFDSGMEPLSINLEYVPELGLLKLHYVEMNYLSAVGDFPSKAACPAKPE